MPAVSVIFYLGNVTSETTCSSGDIGSNKNWSQSPIDLKAEDALSIQLPPLVMSGHWSQDGNARLVNTGSTARVTLGSGRYPATIRGGPFGDDVYQLDEVAFRWGPSDCMGAEHTLNGTWFTMEAQALHWNIRYGSFENCWDKRDGLAICSYFLQVYQLPAWEEHPLFSKITDSLPEVIQPGISVKIPPNSLCWMRQACQTPGYYTYQGSITTSPYYECVTWIVFPEPVRISEHQAKMFRTLRNKYGSYIRENYRSVQQLNGRLVYYARTRGNQSPINIDTLSAIPRTCPPIVMNGHAEAATNMILINTGHTVEIRPAIDSHGAFLSGGPLDQEKYKFLQFHFHWGSENAMGSEHSIDGNFYSMEGHFVHYNQKYQTVEVSGEKPDGLAAVAIFFELNEKTDHNDHPVISGITNHLRSATKTGETVNILSDVLAWVKDYCLSCKEYYTYNGSLTSPPYTENVTWLVYPVPVQVGKEQIDLFRQLKGSEGGIIASNRRQTQLLDGRQVYIVRNTLEQRNKDQDRRQSACCSIYQ